jgi:hypothetical protein
LDGFWARETATVEANAREARRYIFEASLMGIVKPYPPRGPFPVEDVRGMGPAAVLLMRSLDKGKNSEFVQHETIRKVCSHFSNFIHTIPGGIGDMFISSDNVVNGISRSATNTPWFKRFMKGCHSRMGDVWCPDRPLTMQEGLLSQSLLEEDWKTFEKDAIGRLRTAITGMMITVGLGGGMRGEEMVLRVDVGLIRKHCGQRRWRTRRKVTYRWRCQGDLSDNWAKKCMCNRWRWSLRQGFSIDYGCIERCRNMHESEL